jgi:lipopolysaccharide/colanic/teichoic acid biosynthesis glycosyltransferase
MTVAKRFYPPLKRLADIVSAIVALVVLSPILIGVAAVVAVKLGRPVLFVQERPGRGGAPFSLYKFRSMSAPADDGSASDHDRLGSFGKTLRSTSLDELPALVNVLKGDMSMVGPRPLLMKYLHRYTAEQARRHEVRPGITGLAQASGRNNLSWEERFLLDVEYVDRMSPLLDVQILVRTVTSVVRREGVSAPGEATMFEFLGTDDQTGQR